MTDLVIPAFLIRKPGDVRTVFSVPEECKRTAFGPIAQANIKRLNKVAAREKARGTVLKAIKAGADTFGKIRKATGIEDDGLIRSALRRYINNGRVEQNGRRYYTF